MEIMEDEMETTIRGYIGVELLASLRGLLLEKPQSPNRDFFGISLVQTRDFS